MSLDAISIPARNGQAQGLLVLLHGWGANAQDVATVARLLQLPSCQLLFPNAPFFYPYGGAGRAWYNFPDNYSFLGQPEFRDRPDLVESRKRLTDWLNSLEASTGIPLSRTVLAGFSQGGAMTLDVGTHLPVAGLVVLSGYLHAPVDPLPPNHTLPPVLIVHGRQDAVVPLRSAHQSRDALLQLGAPVQYRELDMGHEVQPIVLSWLQSFMQERGFSADTP